MAKKAFDVVARNSLRGIADILSERFKGNAEVRHHRRAVEPVYVCPLVAPQVIVFAFAQVLRLRDELELKVDALSLPVDVCVQHALQGNSALQGALNVALRVLQDIEDYEANLRQQEIDTVSYLPVLFSPAISLLQHLHNTPLLPDNSFFQIPRMISKLC